MPIVFAPADPVSPSLSAAAGYADEFAKLFPSMASLAAHQFSAQQASVNSGPQSYQQAQQFQQQMQQQAGMQTQALSAQSNMQNAAQTAQSQMMNQQTQNNLYEQQQAAQQEIAQQWTSQDESQLSQVQNGWSQVQADPSLSPEEKQQAQQQYLPYIQQQQQKKQYWLTKMKGQQQQELAEQTAHIHAQNAAMGTQQKKFEAGNMDDMIYEKDHYDPVNGNWIGKTVKSPDGKGGWDTKHFEGDTKKPDHAAADAAKAYDTEVKHRDLDEKRYTDAYVKAEGIVNAMRKETIKKGDETVPKYPNLDSSEKADWNGQQMTPYEANVVDHLTKMGFPPKKADYLAQKAQERAAMRGEKPKESQVDQSDQPKKGAMNQEEKPFSFDQKDKTPNQTATVDLFNKLDQRIADTGLLQSDPALHLQARQAYDQMKGLIQKYGSTPAMKEKAPEEYKLYESAKSLVKGIVDIADQRKAQQPPAEQQAAPQRPAAPPIQPTNNPIGSREWWKAPIASWKMNQGGHPVGSREWFKQPITDWELWK